MERRRIGKTDLECSPVGFGTWEMSTTDYGHIDTTEATNAVHAAIDHGINLFDTAESYGPFLSEELLARSLGGKRKDVILVDKIGNSFSEDGRAIGRNSRYEHLLERSEGCLRRLNTDMIDLMLIHWPDMDTPYDEPMLALEKLKSDGKIRHGGVSNFNIEMLEYCQQFGEIAVNQVGYHLFDQRMDRAMLPYCLENRIGFMAYGTLGFGLLSGAFTPETTFAENDWRSFSDGFGVPLFTRRENFLRELRVGERLKEFAKRYGRSLPQLAIAWVLGNPAVSVALVGLRNEKELEENVAATEWQLTPKDRAAIDEVLEEEGCPTYRDYPQRVG